MLPGRAYFSGSLDGHVKVYDVSTFEMVFGYQCENPILSMDISLNSSRIVVGMAGVVLLCARERSSRRSRTHLREELHTNQEAGGTFCGPQRKSECKRLSGSFASKSKVKAIRHSSENFSTKKLPDAVLQTRQPALVASMLKELIARAALVTALTGRNEASLEPILSFLVKYVANPRYSDLLSDVCDTVLNIYSPIIGKSMAIDDLFLKLHQHLKQELTLQKKLTKLSGKLDLCMF